MLTNEDLFHILRIAVYVLCEQGKNTWGTSNTPHSLAGGYLSNQQ